MQHGMSSWSPHLSGPQGVDGGFKPRLTDEYWSALWCKFFQADGAGQSMAGASGLRASLFFFSVSALTSSLS